MKNITVTAALENYRANQADYRAKPSVMNAVCVSLARDTARRAVDAERIARKTRKLEATCEAFARKFGSPRSFGDILKAAGSAEFYRAKAAEKMIYALANIQALKRAGRAESIPGYTRKVRAEVARLVRLSRAAVDARFTMATILDKVQAL